MQWAVFEPNETVRRAVFNFMHNLWKDGSLHEYKSEGAFLVKRGRTTMTQNDMDNGNLVMEVGIAPLKPVKFIICRVRQLQLLQPFKVV